MDGTNAQHTHRVGRTDPATSRTLPKGRPGADTAASERPRGPVAPGAVPPTKPDAGRSETDQLGRFRAALIEAIGADAVARHLDSDAQTLNEHGSLKVLVTSSFHKGVLERRFAAALRTAAESAGFGDLSIDVDESARAARSEAVTTSNGAPRVASGRRQRTRNDARFELSAFVVGPSNRMAYSAIKRVASDAGGREFSPLFLHGESGLGKTHLLQGAASEYRRHHPNATVRYTTAEAFTNSYITAVRAGGLDAFRKAWRGVDLLCVDDVHFFSGKVSTQAELQHTFDAIDLEGACVVLASDAHPRQLKELAPGLVSRLLSGAVVRIDPPDEKLRHELICRMAAKRGVMLSDDAVVLLAARAGVGHKASVRDLEGMLTQVIAVAQLLPEFINRSSEIGLVAVRRALGLGEWTQARPGSAKPVKLEAILDQACESLGVQQTDLYGRTRHRRVVLARTLVAYLCREMTTRSYPEIARAMRRPTHSTIVAAKQRYDAQVQREEIVAVGCGLDGLTMGQLAERVRAEIESPSKARKG